MKLKKMKLNKKIVSLYGLIFAFIATITICFAWFTGIIERNGLIIHTGEIIVDANCYSYENGELLKKTQDINDNQQLAAVINKEKSGDLFFIVERDEDSIEVDFHIILTLENGTDLVLSSEQINDDEVQYLGGYWFKIDEITEEVSSASLLTNPGDLNDNELSLYSYVKNADDNHQAIPNNGVQNPFSILSGNGVYGSLENDCMAKYYVFSYGYLEYLEEYTNKDLKIRASMYVAQLGALTEGEQASTIGIYHINNLAELLKYKKNYSAGSTFIIEKSFTYTGDLVFTIPCNLKVVNSTLTVEGNLIFSFPYKEEYYIDTATKGKIVVDKVGQSGGSLMVKTPGAKVNFIGKGYLNKGGDIYCQDEIIIDASYDEGAIFSGVNFYNTDYNGKPNSTDYKKIYFKDNTCLTISEDTYISHIEAYVDKSAKEASDYVKPEVVKIVNYGIIDELQFEMQQPSSGNPYTEKPQILFDNYGTYDVDNSYLIQLPTWSSKYLYDEDDGYISGNTRIIQEIDSNILRVTQSISSFTDNDIIRVLIDELYIVNQSEGGVDFDVTINYADEFDYVNNVKITNTVYSIVYKHYNPTITYTASKDQITFAENKLKQITKLKVVSWQGKIFTESENTVIKEKCSNLSVVDYEEALFTNNSVYKNLFTWYSNITRVILPNTATYIENDIIGGTSVTEITIPATVSSVSSYAFRMISPNDDGDYLIIHAESSNYTYRNILEGKTSTVNYYICVNETLLKSVYQSEYQYDNYIYCPESMISDNYEYLYRITEDGKYQIVRYLGGYDHLTLKDIEDEDGNITLGKFTINDELVYASSIYDRAFDRPIQLDSPAALPYQFNKISFENTVTSIGNYSFYNLQAKTLDLNNVETIGNYTFTTDKAANNNKIDLIIGNQVKEIGNYTFAYLQIPDVRIPNVETLGDYTFTQSTLKSCEYSYLKTIGIGTFISCNTMVYFKAPEVESIGTEAFKSCSKLELLYLPSSNTFGEQFFNNCSKLKEVYIGAYQAMTGTRKMQGTAVVAYYICGMEGKEEMESTDTFTSSNFFGGDSNYRIFISDDLYLYYKNNWLKGFESNIITCGNVNAKDLKKAGTYIPSGCTLNIGEIVCSTEFGTENGNVAKTLYFFPATLSTTVNTSLLTDNTYYTVGKCVDENDIEYVVNEIGDKAYNACTFTGIKLKIHDDTTICGDYNFNKKGFIEINTGGLTEIRDHTFEESPCTSFIFPHVLSIGEYCFNKSKITYFSSSTLVNVGKYAFSECTALTNVDIPNAANIGQYAFNKCTGIKTIELLGAKIVDDYAFSGCSNIESITFDDLDSIGNNVCVSLYSLKNVVINDCKTIGNSAFYDCQSLSNSYSLDSLTSIGTNVFYKTAITSFSAPLLTEIPESVFNEAKSMTSMNLPSVVTIGDAAFYYCGATEYGFTNKVTSIGNSAFKNSNIEKAIFPNVTSIGIDIFHYCYKLTTIEFDSLNTISNRMFANNTLLTRVYMPNVHYFNPTGTYWDTFSKCYNIVELYIGQIYDGGKLYSYSIAYDCTIQNCYICGATPNKSYPSGKIFYNNTDARYFWTTPMNIIISDEMLNYIGIAAFCDMSTTSDHYYYRYIKTGTTDPLDVIKYGDCWINGVNVKEAIFTVDYDSHEASIIKAIPRDINEKTFNSDTYITPGEIYIDGDDEPFPVTYIAATAYQYTSFNNINLVIHDNVKSIAAQAFECGFNRQYVRNILSINTGKLTYIPTEAFRFFDAGFNSSCYVFEINMPEVIEADFRAFYSINCQKIIAPKLTIARNESFSYTGFVEGYFPLLQKIGQDTFSFCTNVVRLDLPSLTGTLASNNWGLFRNCSNLEVLYMPKYSISPYISYTNCPKLYKVYIGCLTSYNSSLFYDSSYGYADNIRYLYICGTELSGTAYKSGQNPRYHVDVFVSDSIYSKMCTIFEGKSNITVINIGPGDAKDLIGVGETTIEGLTLKYPENEYYLDENGDAFLATSHIQSISGSTFTVPTSVEIPDVGTKNIVGIADYSYYYTNIDATNVIVPSTIKYFGSNVFGSSKKFIHTSIDSETIRSSAFEGITTLKSVEIGSHVTSIGINAFNGMTSGIMTINNTTSVIPSAMIFGSDLSNQVTLHAAIYDDYLNILPWAGLYSDKVICHSPDITIDGIKYYYSVENSNTEVYVHHMVGIASIVTIPNQIDGKNVTYVASRGMQGVTGLATLNFPRYMKTYNFNYLNEPATLEAYSISSDNEFYSTDDGVLYNKDKSLIISYPRNKADATFSLSSKLSYIPSFTFAFNPYLEEITFNSDCFVDMKSFFDCSSLTTINAYGNISIEANAFGECNNLSTIYIDGNATFGGYSFDGCIGLTEIEVDGDSTFGSYAFNDCTSLTTISVTGSADVYSYAFDGCNLSTVSFDTKSNFNSYAFANSSSNLTVNLNDTVNVSSLKGYCFFDGVNIYTINVPDTLIENYKAIILFDQDIIAHIQ